MNALDLEADGFLTLPEEDFVREAYRRLLARAAAPAEIANWLVALRAGGLTRLELVAAIRCSPEARQREEANNAISRPNRIGGYMKPAAHWLRHLTGLGQLAMRVRTLEATAETSVRRIDARLDASQARLEQVLRDALGRIDELREALVAQTMRTDALVSAAAKLAQEARPSTESLADYDCDAIAATQAFDAYYRRFEDRFRGAPEEIRSRLVFYVPILVAAAQQASPGLVVDVGCGRGELLDLLRDQSVSAYGVERSEAMATICRERGLAVVEADALEHFTALAADSLAGVTCIHVIEHLPFAVLMKFAAQTMRVLRPGGVAIFETPNPENLIVGACNFYYDPTHRRPLPPEPMRFLLEAAGFERVAIERLHASASPDDLEGATDPITKLYTTLMLVPQDYALIAYKPLSSSSADSPA